MLVAHALFWHRHCLLTEVNIAKFNEFQEHMSDCIEKTTAKHKFKERKTMEISAVAGNCLATEERGER